MSFIAPHETLSNPIALPDGQLLMTARDLHQHIDRMSQPRPLVFDVIVRMLDSARTRAQVENAARIFKAALEASPSKAPA